MRVLTRHCHLPTSYPHGYKGFRYKAIVVWRSSWSLTASMLSCFFVASLLSHLSVVGHTLVVSPPIESGLNERRFNADDGQIVGQKLMKVRSIVLLQYHILI